MSADTIFLNADRAGDRLPPNPFVGLRPFNIDEGILFFGRDRQLVELLQRLHSMRFLAVVGSSGCGKSSLIRAGLIPKLKAGFIVERNDRWEVVTTKPGDSPLKNVAEGLLEVAGGDADSFVKAMRVSGAKAVLERVAPALERRGANLLLLVDQFEELFRYGGQTEAAAPESPEGEAGGEDEPTPAESERLREEAVRRIRRRDEATRFVTILLDLARQSDVPVYVVLTMRSDFLGDCDAFPGLPEAINQSIYLVPRLDREQRQEAVENPVRLYGGSITQRLLSRVVNDVGDEPDQLPVMQHALMRTWEEWKKSHGEREGLDLRHYEAAGTFAGALSNDADAALAEVPEEDRIVAERMFQALVDTDAQGRRTRRPAHLREIAEVAGATPEKVFEIIDRFRSGGRCFLTPSSEKAVDDPVIDISHESFIRQWGALRKWVKAESESKEQYTRLATAALRHKAGGAGLWTDPELAAALKWWDERDPNEAWARRYNPAFQLARDFLRESENKSVEAKAAEERRRLEEIETERMRLQNARLRRFTFALVFLSLFAVLGLGAAITSRQQALESRMRAEKSQILSEESRSRAEALASKLEGSLNDVTLANDEATRQRDLALTAQHEAEKEKTRANEQAKIAKSEAAAANKAREDLKRANEAIVQERKKVLADLGSRYEQVASIPADDEKRMEKSTEIYKEILKVYEKDDVRVGRFSTLLLLGTLYNGDDGNDDVDKAKDYYSQALALIDESNPTEKAKKVKTLVTVGDLLNSSDSAEAKRAAADRYEQALKLGYEPVYEEYSDDVYVKLGEFYGSSQNAEERRKAITYYDRERVILDRQSAAPQADLASLLSHKLDILIKTGTLYRRLGDTAEAGKRYDAAIELSRGNKDEDFGESNALVDIGVTYDLPDEEQERDRYFQRAVEKAKTSNSKEGEASVYSYIGISLTMQTKFQDGLTYLKQAETMYRAAGEPGKGLGMTLYYTGYTYEKLNMKREACEGYWVAYDIFKQTKNFTSESVSFRMRSLGCEQKPKP